ncbi:MULTISPECIES: hypothetical protein [unclassified Streptomyces]|uniref:hypothetical protein n=1 Tax=unclassified Streptomyces TaxID=2593676 RepID=UPI003D8E0467
MLHGTTDEAPEMFQARYEDISAIRWPRPADPQEDRATLDARHLAWNAWYKKTVKAAQEHGPQHDALLVALEDLVEIKRDADEKIRLLLAYGRIFHQPRPHTLESLGAAAGLSPSGVSRAFGAEEVMAVAELTGKRPPAVDVQRHDPDVISGQASKNRCTWGGSKAKPCTETPKYAVTDKSGAKWACCDKHLPGYLRSRV